MRTEGGQTSVLIIGFAFVLLLMVGVVVDSSAAYLQRQDLDTLADGAALAGADEVRGSGVYEGGLTGQRAPLDAAAARAAVRDYLLGIGAYDERPRLSFDVAIRNRSVIVRVSAPLDLPVTVESVSHTRVDARGAAVVEVYSAP